MLPCAVPAPLTGGQRKRAGQRQKRMFANLPGMGPWISCTPIVVLSLLFNIIGDVQAQDVSRAAVQMDFQNGYWVMDFSAGAAETSRALQAAYPGKELSKMDVTEYNTLFLKYLVSRLEVVMDSQPVVFKQVNFGTNSMEARAKLISPRFATQQDIIVIRLDALKENAGHSTSVNAYDGNVVRQAVLNADNDFSAVLLFGE